MVQKKIDKKIIEIIEATSFPPVALRIYNLVSRTNTSMAEIETSILMDPVLSAKVLQVANSPFFNRGRQTDTLDHALALIGFNAVQMVVLCAALHELYKSASIIDKKMWAHSLGVSLIASMLAKETGLVNEHIASTAGLFHDSGKLVLKNASPEQYAVMSESLEGSNLSFCDAENKIFGVDHQVTGTLLAKNWNLSKEYSIVIAFHHKDEYPTPIAPHERNLLNVIKIADEIAFFFGIGLRKKVDLYQLPYKSLGITKKRFDELIWQVNEIYEEYVNSLSF
jgi:putative nucleotidyltransferase with HDIG domain